MIVNSVNSLYHTESAGPLPRPAYLTDARQAYERGELAADELAHAEDRAVDEAIALQEDAGIDVVTDGQLRRYRHAVPLTTVGGVTGEPAAPGGPGARSMISVTYRIGPGRQTTAAEFSYARARADRPVKVSLPSPFQLYQLWQARTWGAYPDPWQLAADGAQVIIEEVRGLVAAGCTWIEIDAPELVPLCCGGAEAARWEQLGLPVRRAAAEAPRVLCGIAGTVPDEATCALRLSGGEPDGYQAAARRLFPQIAGFDRLLLGYGGRAPASFKPLAAVPEDMTVALGLIPSPQARDRSMLAACIGEAARYTGLGRLALAVEPGAADGQRDRLRLAAETAHQIWQL